MSKLLLLGKWLLAASILSNVNDPVTITIDEDGTQSLGLFDDYAILLYDNVIVSVNDVIFTNNRMNCPNNAELYARNEKTPNDDWFVHIGCGIPKQDNNVYGSNCPENKPPLIVKKYSNNSWHVLVICSIPIS